MGAKDQGADPSTVKTRWQVVPRTLCFITHGDDILLMKRAPHKRVFPNHYNGVGGHIEANEDPLTGAVREIQEETGLSVTNMQYCGTTHINAGQQVGIMLFIYTAEALSRDFVACDEGELQWLPLATLIQKIETQNDEFLLVEDLPYVLPLIFKSKAIPFFAHVSYRDDGAQIVFKLANS